MKKITLIFLFSFVFALQANAQSASCGETVVYTQVANGDYSITLTGGNPAMVTVNGDLETSWSGCYDYIYVRDGSGSLLNTEQSCGIFQDKTYTSTDGTISVQITNDGSTQYGDISLQFACDMPSCNAPTDLAVSDVTYDGATIAWTSDDSLFNIEVVDVTAGGTATGTATSSGVTSSYSLSGLSSNNEYEVYVQTDCGSQDTSAWAGPLTLTTKPLCGDTVTHCYEGGNYSVFDATVDNSGDYITATILTGDTESCCDTLIVYDSSDNSGNILYSERGDHSGQVITSTTGTISVWVDADGTWDCDDGGGGPYDQISVELSCTPPPSCIAPSALTASNVLTTSADLSWTAGGSETDYEYVVQAAGTGEPTGDGIDVTGATSVSVGLLSANTAYEVYVRSACTGEFSDWSDVLNFTTSTDPLVIGASCFDFEMGGLGSSVGLTENTQSSASLMASAGNASSNGIVLTGGSSGINWTGYSTSTTETNAWVDNVLHQSAVVIEVDATAESTVILTFDLKQTYSYGHTYSNFRVTVNDTQIGSTLYPSNASLDPFVNQNYDLSAYAGTLFTLKLEFSGKYSDEYAASTGYAGDSAYVDNICVTAPSCLAPTGITVSQITDCCADFSWTAGGSETDYEYVVQAAGTGEPTGAGIAVTGATTVSAGPYASNTEFEVYVRSNCGVDGFSSWAGPVNFTTEPAPIVPNYTNDFATFPDLWSKAGGDLATGPSGTTFRWVEDTFANDGVEPALRFNVYSTNTGWLITPMFDLSSGVFYLNVDAAAVEWASTTDDAIWESDDFATLMASTDGGSTWVELYRWDGSNNPGVAGAAMPEITLNNYSATSKFAFYGESSVPNGDIEFFIDNFQITTTSLGIEEASMAQFTYFPNPVNDVLTIKAQKAVKDITVFNMLGQVVKQQTPNTMDCTVDLSAMQSGAYFVQVSIDNTLETVRVLKK